MKKNVQKSKIKTKEKTNHKTLIINTSLIVLLVVSALLMVFYHKTMAAPNNLPDSITVYDSEKIHNNLNYENLKQETYEQYNSADPSKFVYCLQDQRNLMGKNHTTVYYKELNTDPGLVYLLVNGYTTKDQLKGLCEGCSSHDEYMITQYALWIYVHKQLPAYKVGELGSSAQLLMNYDANTSTYSVGNFDTKYTRAVVNLLNGASNAKKNPPTYDFSFKDAELKLNAISGGFETSQVGINATTPMTYQVSIEAPTGYYIVTSSNQTITDVNKINNTSFNSNETFKIVIPDTAITSGNLTVKVKVKASFTKNAVAVYEPPAPNTANIQTGVYSTIIPDTIEKENSTQVTLPKGKLKVIKTSVNENGETEYVKGAKLRISSTDDTNFSAQEWVTDGTAKEFTDLIPGKTYVISEVAAATGYVDTTEKKTYKVKASDCYTTDDNITTIEMKNEYTKVQVGKVDINTGEYIAGATLAIKNQSDGSEYTRIVTTNEPTTITKIPVGTYVLEEVEAPAGYILNSTKLVFTVLNTGKVQSQFIKNNYTKISVKDQKITISMSEVGFKISIRDNTGKEVEKFTSNGKPYTTKELEPGKYTVVETEAPAGYTCMPTPIDVAVVAKGESVPDIIFANDYTKVQISKIDMTNEEELPGAELEIRDEKGNVIEKWTSTETPHKINKLPVGKYVLSETVAPDGYVLSKSEVNFEVKETGELQTVTMKNEKKVEVPDTEMNASVIRYTCGAVMIASGIGLVVYNVLEQRKKKRK